MSCSLTISNVTGHDCAYQVCNNLIECSQCREAIWDEVNMIYNSESRSDKEAKIKKSLTEPSS